MKPFLKWAGNKRAIINRIRDVLPEGRRLIEPFAGSAAVFLATNYKEGLLSDCNADLIGLFKVLQDEGAGFIAYCKTFFTAENNKPDVYYTFRDEFNRTSDKKRKAALFLYLNRHGYNGLCRYNASGKFNVPLGRYVKPYFPAEEMRAFHARVQCAEFRVADFREAMECAVHGDVVYCDPPYVPLSTSANFTSYCAAGFGEEEQGALAILAEKLALRGVPVIISNHDTSFTVHAYRKAILTRFKVRRTISSNGQNRGRAEELLAFFKAA